MPMWAIYIHFSWNRNTLQIQVYIQDHSDLVIGHECLYHRVEINTILSKNELFITIVRKL